MLEVSLRALEEATVQQDGTAWQASVFDGAMQADGQILIPGTSEVRRFRE